MYIGSKGFYIQKLKELGVKSYNGRKLESYKGSFLAHILKSKILNERNEE
jgi:hypothetical protein